MALSVLLTVTGGVILGAEAVNKSFPDFFDKLKEAGVKCTYGMDK
jgi:3-phosphoshikimate 1-carboxyvinyltransferase